MEQTTIPYYPYDIYSKDNISINNMNNRLLCTFVPLEKVDSFIEEISSQYTILYNKVFILHIKSNDEYVCTYNIEQPNIKTIPDNTILVHRKKESNSLYTVNALNELIRGLNKGVLDTRYPIDWQQYRNTILLTQQGTLKELKTKIYKIVEL